MKLNISELMDGLGDETLELYGRAPVRAERVLALAAERGGARPRKRPRKMGRILLVAAALAALLSVTAYAVYERFVEDYVIEQQQPDPLDLASEERPGSRISLVGYQGTPEYQAYVEWDALQDRWWEEKQALWEQQGVDDSWHEGPDNYCYYYNVTTREQADELDAIMEKYGLTPHTEMASFRGGETLYDALGTGPFYGGVVSGELSGYIYEDGSFHTEGSAVFADGRKVLLSGFTNVKGSFVSFEDYIDMSQGYDEWSYTTSGGAAVTLLLAPDDAELFAETDGAYINLGLRAGSDPADPDWHTVDRSDMQALADSIDFAVLAARFDGGEHPVTAEKVSALAEQERLESAQRERYAAPTAAPETPERTDQQAMDAVGTYGLAGLEAGYTGGDAALSGRLYWTDRDVYDMGQQFYSYGEEGSLDLNWYRFYTDDSLSESATAEAFADARAYLASSACKLRDIAGGRGFAVRDDWGDAQAAWLDEERDLLFILNAYDTQLSPDELAALAGTVTEETPAVLPTPEPTALPAGTWTAQDLARTLGDYSLAGLELDADWTEERLDVRYAEEGYFWSTSGPIDLREARWYVYDGAGYTLDWMRCYTSAGRTASATAENFAGLRESVGAANGDMYRDCPVGEQEGYLVTVADNYLELTWLDADRDLIFTLRAVDTGLDADGLVALAGTLTGDAGSEQAALPDLAEVLGQYTLAGLPDGVAYIEPGADEEYAEQMGFMDYACPGVPKDQRTVRWGPDQERFLAGEVPYRLIVLTWSRYYTDKDRSQSDTAQAFAQIRQQYVADNGGTNDCQVGGSEGLLGYEEGHNYKWLIWLDSERDLVFYLEVEDSETDAEGLIALAETVTESE